MKGDSEQEINTPEIEEQETRLLRFFELLIDIDKKNKKQISM